nr:zinc finger, CCHC-type [Tanacetum cinerariifolium]
MAGNTVKDMTTNFEKLDKFEGHDFRRWQKKMHLLLTTLKVVYVLKTPMPKLLEDATMKAIRIRAKWENDDYICRGRILNGLSDSPFYVYTNVESAKELWDSLESKVQDSDKGKGKKVGGSSVNITGEGKNKYNKQNKGKKRSNENNSGSSSNKKPKLECKKCGKTGHFKRDFRSGNKKNTNAGEAFYLQDDAIAWWIDFGATTHVCKDCCWFKTYEPAKDRFVLYMGDDHFAPVHGKGSVVLEFNLGKSITLFTVLYVPKLHKNLISGPVLNKCGYKQAIVRFLNPKRKTLGEKGIDCIFVGYAEHSKACRFYVIKPNDSVSINSIIESRDTIFDEKRFSSILRPKDIIPNSVESQRDDHSDVVSSEIPEPRKGKRVRKAKSYGSDFQLYLVKGSRDQVGSQYCYCYSIKDDPRTYNEAMQS